MNRPLPSISIRLLVLFTGMTIVNAIHAQDLSTMGIKKGIHTNGSIQLTNILYHTNDTVVRRDPYQFILSGNLNLNLFGYAAPFTFTYSNSQKSYTQPFNRLSFNPQYKWIRAYIGYTSMTFSPYTLSGYTFLGAGAELTPGSWRIAFMGGQLKKAIDYDPLKASLVVPSYRRMGFGFKIGYDRGTSGLSLNLFTAKDIERSVHQLPTDGSLHPMQNLAMGISAKTLLLQRLTLQGEYTLSLLNTDTRLQNVQSDSSAVTSSGSTLSTLSPGTQLFHAYSAAAGYQTAPFGITIKYERVDPDYQTLGAYYFNNDMENITIMPNLRLLKGRLSIAGNGGLQKNNLDKSKESTTRRWVGSGNINFSPNEKWSLTTNYSNFSTYTKVKPQTDPFFKNDMDSLNFYQTTNNLGGSVNYTFGKKETPSSMMINGSYQEVKEVSAVEGNSTNSGYLSGAMSYVQSFTPQGLTLSLSYTLNISNAVQSRSLYHGPALNLGKTFLDKKARGGLTAAWNQNTVNGIKGSPVLSSGLNLGYNPRGNGPVKHTFTCSLNWLQRFPSQLQKTYRSEITGNLNYAFSF